MDTLDTMCLSAKFRSHVRCKTESLALATRCFTSTTLGSTRFGGTGRQQIEKPEFLRPVWEELTLVLTLRLVSPRGPLRSRRPSPKKRFISFPVRRHQATNVDRKPTGADGDPGTETTLGHVLNMYGNGPNVTIGEVMDIQGDYLCYEYIEV